MLKISQLVRNSPMLSRSLGLIFAFLISGAFAPWVEAQPTTIAFENGDQIQGQLLNLTEGVLEVETSWGGVVAIDFAQIRSLETEEAVTLETATGEVHSGRLSLSSGELKLHKAGGEMVSVALADLAAINPPPPASLYSGSISLGANVQSGNTDQQTLSAAFDLTREKEKNTFNFALRWVDAEQNDIETASSTFAAFKYERTFKEKLYGYGSLELLEDAFKDLDLRTVASVGFGYHVLDTDRRTLSLEGGLSYFSRDYISIPDEDEITVRLAGYYTWTLAEGVVLRDALVIYPSFEDGTSLTFRNEFGITTELLAGWSLDFASILDYEEEPPPGIEKEDWLWVLGLNYSF